MSRPMKDSGVKWIGDIPEHWLKTKLSKVSNCYDGKRVPIDKSLRKEGPYPYWGAGSITGYVDDFLFDEEIILLGEDGAPFFDKGRNVAHLVREKVWVNNHIHVLKGKENVKNNFLVHYLNTVDYGSYINGSILNKLTQGNMNKIAVVIPSLDEQQKIATFLDEKTAQIDSIINNTKQSLDEFKKYKQAIITETVTKGLNPNVKMKNTGMDWFGDIPEHWEIHKLNHLVSQIGDIDHRMPESQSEGVPYVSPLDFVGENDIDFSNAKKISERDYQELSRKIKPELGDIIFARYATIGTVRLVKDDLDFLVSYSCLTIKTNKRIFSEFLFYYLKSATITGEVEQRKKSNTQSNIGLEDLKSFKIPLPPINEQQQIVAYLDEKCAHIDSLIADKEKLIGEFQDYKKALIYEYVTGKKEVE